VTAIGPEPPEEDTSIIVRKCAAGELGALDKLVHRYNRKMIQLANRYMRRLRLYNPAFDAEDAVHNTLIKLFHRANDCQLDSVQSSVKFWRVFFSMLKCEIRDARDHFASRKQGGPGARRSRRRAAHGGLEDDGVPTRGQASRSNEDAINSLYSLLPPPEDLALIKLEIEEFLQYLNDPISQRIMILMVESHTNKEIADLLDVNERTIERRVATIRVRYFRYHHKDLL
jgi:RNA polymerase sigma factor (sigma-70 family)